MNYKISLIAIAIIAATVLLFAKTGNVQKPAQDLDVPVASPIVVSQPVALIEEKHADVTVKTLVEPARPPGKPVQTPSQDTMAPPKTASVEQSVSAIQPTGISEQALVAAVLEPPITHSVIPALRVNKEVIAVPVHHSAPTIEPVVVRQPDQQPVQQPQIVPAKTVSSDFTIYTELSATHKSTSAGAGLIYNNLIGADIYATNTHNNYNPGVGAGLQAYATKNLLSFLPESLALFADLGALYHTHPGSVIVADAAGHLAYKPSGTEWLINYGGGVNVQIPVSSNIIKNAVINLGYGSVKGATIGLGLTW